jgi:hypothetical protein
MKHELTVGSNKSFRVRFGSNWLRLAVGSVILLLPLVGGICAWRAPHLFAFQNRLFAFAVTLGPAAIYAFGYFRVFPEVLGTETKEHEDSLVQRWASLARMSSAVAIIVTWVCWASIVARHFRGIIVPLNQTPAFINFFVLGTLSGSPGLCVVGAIFATALMTITVVASEQFVARTIDPTSACSNKNWPAVVLRIVGRCGEWLIRLLRPKAALLLGAVLILFSLMVAMGPFEGFGLEVVTGDQHWPTAEYTLQGPAGMVLSEVGRFMYVATLALAVLALAAVAARRKGDRLRKTRVLASVSTVIAIFALCDLPLGVARLDSTVPPLLNLVVLGLLWALPIALWMWREGGDSVRRNRTRIGVMVLYLPVVLAALALLPLALILVPGYASFMLGTGFLTLGFLRSRWEATLLPIPLETVPKIPQAA